MKQGAAEPMTNHRVFDEHTDLYDQWFIENPDLFDAEAEAIGQLLPRSGEGIEIGAGTGLFAERLGISRGVEPSANMAARARARGVQIIEAYAEELPLPDRSCQFALMVTVDCFLADITAAFHEIHRILDRNGCFIIAFIDKATPLGAVYEEKKASSLFYRSAEVHSAAEIEGYLLKSGFKIEDRRQTVFTLENQSQEIKKGTGEGVFAVIKARKRP
jgi:SAM-dependent methyltransferase